MKRIIPNINTLLQYIIFLNAKPKLSCCCEYCGSCNIWCHGCYYRKSDRDRGELNPIAIPRFLCCNCGRTFSVLPECIAPRCWYLWNMQQEALVLWLKNFSYRAISKKLLPSRKTISRWISRLKEQFLIHADQLRTFCKELGYYQDFQSFWKECLDRWGLSKIMLMLNNAGIIVP